MQPKNKSVMYWKWDDSIIASDLVWKINDLCDRFDLGSIFIGLHWIHHRFIDPEVQNALKLCCDEFHRRGVRVISEACPRNEAATYFEKYPEEIAWLTAATEITLDENGCGSAEVKVPPVDHYWRTIEHVKPAELVTFLIEKTGKGTFAPGSDRKVSGITTVSPEGKTARVQVDAGKDGAGKCAVVFVGIPQTIPDLASDGFGEFYEFLLRTVKEAGVDGVMSDEWGYDVILDVENADTDPQAYRRRELYMEHLTWSKGFDRRYSQVCNRSLKDDLLRLFYTEDGNRAASIRCVNDYHAAFRAIMRSNDDTMYELCKKVLGPDAFYGVHPTWWGNNYLQNFEGFKNALYWWEAKRDIAQVDEIVIMAIRTALAHKWGGDTWYNMWYSMGTRDIKSYFRDTWNSVRYTGRTHYLGYECPNEAVVLELKPAGLLESIEEMDARVRPLDPVQNAMPDCRVLVLFGMQNALNWHYDTQVTPPWYPRHKVLTPVLQTADQLFGKYLCDLVPTTEIENGSLIADGGKVRYGTQTYDAVILLAPNSMSASCYSFLQKVDPRRLIVAGKATEFADGTPLTARCAAVLDRGIRLESIECADKLAEVLADWGIAPNRWDNGCVAQDGSVTFTAEGLKATGNPLSVHVCHGDTRIDFEGEDVLFLQPHGDGWKAVFPAGKCLINGREVTSL